MTEYIWQHPEWASRLTWCNAELAGPLTHARVCQGRLLAKAEHLGVDQGLQLHSRALVDEAMQTSAIEGERLDRDSVRSSVARRLGIQRALVRANRSVDGLVEMILDATTDVGRALDAQRLQSWHAAMFPTGYAGIRKITVAAWRPGPDAMRVVSGGPGKPETVHFEAVPWQRVDCEMAAFLHWFNQPPCIDGLLRAGVAHLRLLTIHPFDDGNGRVTRAMTELALAQDESSTTRLWSLSAQIHAERSTYYHELERAQRCDLDITAWLVWFVVCCGEAIGRAEKQLDEITAKVRFWQQKGQLSLNPRQVKVMNKLLDAGPSGFDGGLTRRKYVAITKTSTATAQRDIADLVELGLLRQGPAGGRSTRYEAHWPTRR